MTDEFGDEEALEEHLEAVKPEPVDQEELDELVEPTHEMRTAQEDERACVDDGERVCDGGGDVGVWGSTCDGLDELVEPVSELRTAQEWEAVDEDGGGGE